MLDAVIVILLLCWMFGYWGPYHANVGPFIHLLIIVAIVVLVIRIVQGRRIV